MSSALSRFLSAVRRSPGLAARAVRLWREGGGRPALGDERAPAPPPAGPLTLEAAKAGFTRLSTLYLDSFLGSGARLGFPRPADPVVSVIIVLHNRAELTFQCLASLQASHFDSLELILVDNASQDRTPQLLDRVDGATVLRNDSDLQFLTAANQGFAEARGKYLLFLNNDLQVLGDSIRAALAVAAGSDDVGGVGGRLILPDGTLQEAGNVIWRGGECSSYVRGGDPFDDPFLFRRDVDYVSGAIFLTRADLFREVGGFDRAYLPAYYEDVDYCVKLWERGKRVVFDPDVVALHYEFGGSANRADALALQQKNCGVFAGKHRAWLARQSAIDTARLLHWRATARPGRRLLFVDEGSPSAPAGPAAAGRLRLVNDLAGPGRLVTLYPLDGTDGAADWPAVRRHVRKEVEVMLRPRRAGLARFLDERRGYYDLIAGPSSALAFLRSRMSGGDPGGAPLLEIDGGAEAPEEYAAHWRNVIEGVLAKASRPA